MAFKADRQTIDDLGIFGKVRENSVYGLFNKTITNGGARILEEMFLHPLSEEGKINERGMIIRYFQDNIVAFPFKSDLFDTIEFYLSNTDSRTRISAHEDNLERRFRNAIGTDTDFQLLQKGVLSVIEMVKTVNTFINNLQNKGVGEFYKPQADAISEIINSNGISSCLSEKNTKRLSFSQTAGYDQEFRYNFRDQLLRLLTLIYHLDVYIAVAGLSRERGFTFAKALPAGENIFKIEDLYHPLVKNPIANSIDINEKNNMIFLTGANMAGKSTFMKAFGISVYLSHMGFPVPAAKMEFSVQNGLFTTINLPDNINMGYSHFYAEVIRVKKVAESINRSKNLIVIFDELFRGTNVKDAYDATVAVTEAFAANKNCIFIISTHIIEAGETLRERCDNIYFVNLPTIMEGRQPKYTYKIAEGITSDRHGMIIINNEGILEILKNVKQE